MGREVSHVRSVGQAIECATLPVLIEVDADGHRSGVAPEDDALLAITRAELGHLNSVRLFNLQSLQLVAKRLGSGFQLLVFIR